MRMPAFAAVFTALFAVGCAAETGTEDPEAVDSESTALTVDGYKGRVSEPEGDPMRETGTPPFAERFQDEPMQLKRGTAVVPIGAIYDVRYATLQRDLR